MNGHESIINLRRSGFKPAFVWLQDALQAPNDCAVTLSPTDNPEALDLRFLVGTTVLAESANRKRLGAMLKACMDAKAKRVITNLHQRDGVRFEVIETTDTDKVMTWQK
jgi:hypothetical protein